MANFEAGGLRFALQGDELKSTKYFDNLRGSKKRPTDLRCPQCEQPVTVKLSPAGKVIDHFAHYPDSICPLKDPGESVSHLNAKIDLAYKMGKFHYAHLIFQTTKE
jgi:competence CoiA-like predicted nuclease